MKSDVENLSPTRVKLSVEVPFDELKPALDAAYRRIAASITIPGFRQGKVPNRVIDQRVGRAAVLDEAINDAINLNLDAALREHEIKFLGRPDVDVTTFEDAAPLAFTAEMDVVPEFDLPDFETLAVTVDSVKVAGSDVEDQLDALRARFGSLAPVERASAKGDVILFDINGTDDGAVVEDLVGSALSYELGTDGMLPGFDDAITGAGAGETRTFAFTPEAGEFEGKELSVDVTVTTVRERALPEADDAFAQLASEFDNIDELRDDLRERLGRVKLLEQGYAARDKLAELLVDSIDFPLPEGVIAQQIDDHFADGHGDDDHRAEVGDEVRKSLKTQLILDKIAEENEIQVNETELSAWLVQQAPRYGMTPDQFAQELVNAGQVPSAVAEVRRGKSLASVLEKAKIVDSNGTVIDLNSIMPGADSAGDGHEGHDHDHDGHEGHDH